MKNKIKYTPGPWMVQHDKIEGARPVCQLYHPCGDIVDWPTDTPDDGDREAEANAQLIAAAPELLAALEFCADALNTEAGGLYKAHIEQARAAIAKARNS